RNLATPEFKANHLVLTEPKANSSCGRWLAAFDGKDPEHPRRFSVGRILATPTVRIPLAPAGSQHNRCRPESQSEPRLDESRPRRNSPQRTKCASRDAITSRASAAISRTIAAAGLIDRT